MAYVREAIELLQQVHGSCVCVCLCAYSVDDFSLVCDTGAELEQTVAQQFPSIFNGNAGNADRTPEESFDRRSDNRVRHCKRQLYFLQ